MYKKVFNDTIQFLFIFYFLFLDIVCEFYLYIILIVKLIVFFSCLIKALLYIPY